MGRRVMQRPFYVFRRGIKNMKGFLTETFHHSFLSRFYKKL